MYELISLLDFLKELKSMLESGMHDDGDLELLIPDLEERIQDLERLLDDAQS